MVNYQSSVDRLYQHLIIAAFFLLPLTVSGNNIAIWLVVLIWLFSGNYLEKFNKINSYIATSYWDIKVEDNAFVLMQSDNNVIASMHSSATQWKHKFLLEMCFEEGYLNLDGILSGTRSYAPEKLIIGRREFEDITFAMGKPKETIISFENDNSWNLEIEEFINAVNGNGEIKEGTLQDAFETLSLVQKVYENSEI